MSPSPISPENLNAYVDGELSRTQSAAVARAAARDPELATQIATLREMKAALSDMAPNVDIRLPAARRSSVMRTALSVAAGIVIMAFATGIYLLNFTKDAGSEWARALQSRHDNWSFSSPATDLPVVSAREVASILPLDLKSARLTFAGRENIILYGKPVQRIGYKGTRGCRVSLYVFPADTMLDQTAFTPSLLVRMWVIRDHGFALMADGMAVKRFAGLAVAVEKALRSGLDLDSGTRQQLAHARRTSPPCRV